jgi:hypothetical protein
MHNLVSSATASRSGQSSYNPYNLSSDDEEYLMPNNVGETAPGQSDCPSHLLTARRLYLNSPPELPWNWGRRNPKLNDFHSDPKVSSSTFCYWLTLCGGGNTEKYTESTPISPVWCMLYSLSYLTVLEWRPDFPIGKML